MSNPRWTTITESAYPHERSALDRIRAAMPDTGPWRAWSNFTFATAAGKLYEIDLLIAAPAGLHMVELKTWNGEVTATRNGWVQTNESGERTAHGNPLELTWHKSGLLARLLEAAGEPVYIRTLVVFAGHQPVLHLPDRELRYIVPVDALIDRLARPAHNVRHRMPDERAARIAAALENAGIVAPEAWEQHNGSLGDLTVRKRAATSERY